MTDLLLTNANIISENSILYGSSVLIRDGKIFDIIPPELQKDVKGIKTIDVRSNYL